MKNRYNIALLPMTKSGELIRVSQSLRSIADRYLLGNFSLPHVTLYQFDAEAINLQNTWGELIKAWLPVPLFIELAQFSCLTFDNEIYWVSLLPKYADALHNLHKQIAKIMGQPIKPSFDPHVTLINTRCGDYEQFVEKISSIFKPISDHFILALGKCDELGQLTEVIHRL